MRAFLAVFGALSLVAGGACGGDSGPSSAEPNASSSDAGGDASDTATSDGGGSDGGGANGPNGAPTAAFTMSAQSLVAGGAIAFDASASSDPDGDALEYSWSFGDGTRGGVEKIAHPFSTKGSYTVTLTVSDGRGGTGSATQNVTVTAGPAPTGSATVAVRVRDAAGTPLGGASVRVVGGATAMSNDEGVAKVSAPTGVPVVFHAEHAGFVRQVRAMTLNGSGERVLELTLRAAPSPQKLADAAVGGEVIGESGAKVRLGPKSLVDKNGAAVTGEIEVRVTPVDVVAQPAQFPGQYAGLTADATNTGIVSYGTVDFVFTQKSERLDLAPGQTATVDLPVYPKRHLDGKAIAAGDSIPLWSLDENSGLWIQEGTAPVVASASSPTGFVQRAQVRHFSWWNCDAPLDLEPKPVSCCMDADGNDECDGPTVACFVQAQVCGSPDCDAEQKGQLSPNPPPQFGVSTSIGAQPTQLLLPSVPVLLTASDFNAMSEVVLTEPREVVFKLRPAKDEIGSWLNLTEAFTSRAMAADGSAVFATARSSPAGADLGARVLRYVPATGWTPWTEIAAPGGGSKIILGVAAVKDRAVVVWKQGNDGFRASVFSTATGWSAPATIPLGDGANLYGGFLNNNTVAMDDSGRAIFLWKTNDKGFYYSRYTPAGGWSTGASFFGNNGDFYFQMHVNAAGKGGLLTRVPSRLIPYDLATDTAGTPSANLTGTGLTLQVDTAGALHALFTNNDRAIAVRWRPGQDAEPLSKQFTDSRGNNCGPALTATPSGAVAVVTCIADGSLRVFSHKGGDVPVWTETDLEAGGGSPSRVLNITAAGEEFYALSKLNSPAGGIRYWQRAAAASAWSAPVLESTGATITGYPDYFLLGSPSRVFLAKKDGWIWRMK